jgi:hypothetical protein
MKTPDGQYFLDEAERQITSDHDATALLEKIWNL